MSLRRRTANGGAKGRWVFWAPWRRRAGGVGVFGEKSSAAFGAIDTKQIGDEEQKGRRHLLCHALRAGGRSILVESSPFPYLLKYYKVQMSHSRNIG